MMEIVRISIPVSINERQALVALAEKNLRHPQEEARRILQRALKRCTPTNAKSDVPPGQVEHVAFAQTP